jgi:glycosyltransferase involved in cell wall biosynthesis
MVYDLSIVLGSKNRKNLLKATIESIRNNGFQGKMEIIVIDGGSTDDTCNWLAKQKDILTIIQPNYKIIDSDGVSVLAHSWGEFMNIGFKYARAPWIVMVSDDLILAKGALQNGYDELIRRVANSEKIGGGAFYFREYPRTDYYRIIKLPGDNININHGFYYKKALESVNYIDEDTFNFYTADGDLSLRLALNGWQVISLNECFAEHLVHRPKFFNTNKVSPITQRDIDRFNNRYKNLSSPSSELVKIYTNNEVSKIDVKPFWMYAFKSCLLGLMLRYYDKKSK